jgi:hypothetical protein
MKLTVLTRDLNTSASLNAIIKVRADAHPALYFDKVIGTPYIRFRMSSRARGKLTFFVPFAMDCLPLYVQGGHACHKLLWDLVKSGGNILIYSNWRLRSGSMDIAAVSDNNNIYEHGVKQLLPCLSVKAFPYLFKRLQLHIPNE